MRLPKIGEWWQYTSELMGYRVKFIIDDVVESVLHSDSWVIYSNNDGEDFFVARMYDFLGEDSPWKLCDK